VDLARARVFVKERGDAGKTPALGLLFDESDEAAAHSKSPHFRTLTQKQIGGYASYQPGTARVRLHIRQRRRLQTLDTQEEAMTDYVATARQALDNLNKGEFAAVTANFTAALAEAVPTEGLKAQWAQLQQQLGPFKEVVDSQHVQADGMDVAALLLQFENARLVFRLSYKDGVVVGLHMHPPSGAAQNPGAPQK
jgi:hypothetical protein